MASRGYLTLVTAGLSLALMAPARGHVIVTVDPADQTVNLGDTFIVNIYADMTLPIVGWGIDLTISDPNIASITAPPTVGSSWFAANAPDGDGLAGVAFPTAVSGNAVLLATLTMLAENVGHTDLFVGATAGDLTEGFALQPVGQFDTVEFITGRVTVIPGPGAAIVLFIGALAPAFGRRRT